MNDEDEEFEDALDTLEQANLTVGEKAQPQPALNHLPRPDELSIPCPQTYSPSRPSSQFAVPAPLSSTTPQDTLGGNSRRERLAAFRNRMKEEFGTRDVFTPSALQGDNDGISIISDTTSLHSWHRRVLAGPDTVVVLPSDSVSTRAPSTSGHIISSFGSPLESANRICTVPENCPVDIYPSEPAFSSFKACSPGSLVSSPIGPPPKHPPPPLPARERVGSAPTPVTEFRTPPPLPPRNPSIRLPDPVASEVVARLANADTDSFHTPVAKTSTDSVASQGISLKSQRMSTTSNDSISSTGENGSRRRGHAKTNSLDRGLTLAKSLKAGPFPPPSNKSNSLKRPDETDGEEGERNSAAAGVIRQITTGILPDKLPPDTLEPITSGSSSVSSPSSHVSKGNKTENDVENNAVEDNQQMNITDYSLRDEFQTSDIESRLPSTSLSSSIDPITRDVERRMSMKRDGTLNDSLCDDGRSETFSTARSTVGQAKTFAQNYGAIASGLFRGAIQKVKRAGHIGTASVKGVDEDTTDSDGEQSDGATTGRSIGGSIVRPRKAKKGPFDFEQLRIEQEINNEHTGAVWCIRFSICGRLIATAGQDAIIRVWAARSHIKHFQEMRERYQQKADACGSASDVFESTMNDMASFRPPSSADSLPASDSMMDESEDHTTLLAGKPFAVFKGHSADILDLSWSKNYFILSSGMDRTVKLWHLSRAECLCCFQHVDFVTCVAFLPKDDRYFLSGSLDGKLRLWYIPDKKVAVWNEVQVKFITAITFVKNGKFAVVGTYNGRCYFYTSDQLKYHTVVDVRSTRGKNARGHKVTGLAVHGDKLLVTSNDSRIRMYDVRDMALTCKFRGAQNDHSQIRAAFSPDGRHIICGSEDKFVYIWRTSDLPTTLSVRKDRNAMWERVRAHNTPVSVAVFAPKPQVFMAMLDRKDCQVSGERVGGHVIVSADLTGSIKIMVSRPRATKAGQSTFFEQE